MSLLSEIYAYLGATGMSKTYFGKLAVGNSEVVRRLEAKRPIQIDTADKLRTFMRENADWKRARREKTLADCANPRNGKPDRGEQSAQRKQYERIPAGDNEGDPENASLAEGERANNQGKGRSNKSSSDHLE